ncbi:MAG: NTP transferase domain-containing protein [Candidatus Hodarchaeota archaeon]
MTGNKLYNESGAFQMTNGGCIVPIRSIKSGKQRIRKNLPPSKDSQISSLISLILHRTIAFCTQFFDYVWIMTKDPKDIHTRIGEKTVKIIQDPNKDINSSLAIVAREMARTAEMIAVITPDLPLLKQKDMSSLLTEFKGQNAVIAPSKDEGTSALLIPVGSKNAIIQDFHFAFGERSFEKHLKAFSSINLNHKVIQSAGFLWDLDDLSDMEYVLRNKHQSLPNSLLEMIGVLSETSSANGDVFDHIRSRSREST